jgi:flagellar export protein FliJ
MDALALLARLAAQEVERERQALAAIDAQLDEQRRRLEQERASIGRERAAASDLTGARALATWLVASGRRVQLAEKELADLERARTAQLGRLVEQRLELRRMELLQGRQRERRQAAEQAREQRMIDEFALIRAARRPAE